MCEMLATMLINMAQNDHKVERSKEYNGLTAMCDFRVGLSR
jgi:hypothetical protein